MKLTQALAKLSCAAIMSVAAALPTQAALYTLSFSNSGAFVNTNAADLPLEPSASTIYATAVFDDSIGGGKIRLTMSTLNALESNGVVNDWYFNIGVPDPALLSVTHVSGVTAQTVTKSLDCCKANGTGGHYDLRFEFATANNVQKQLARGQSAVYDLDLNGTLTMAQIINQFSLPGNGADAGSYLAAIHVQAYDSDGSVWVGACDPRTQRCEPGTPPNEVELPEPASLLILASGLLGMACLRRRRL